MVNVALIGNNIRWSAGYAETCLSGVGSARGKPTIERWQGVLVRLHCQASTRQDWVPAGFTQKGFKDIRSTHLIPPFQASPGATRPDPLPSDAARRARCGLSFVNSSHLELEPRIEERLQTAGPLPALQDGLQVAVQGLVRLADRPGEIFLGQGPMHAL